MSRVRIKLTKILEELSKKGGYRARVFDIGVVDFDEFTQEDDRRELDLTTDSLPQPR